MQKASGIFPPLPEFLRGAAPESVLPGVAVVLAQHGGKGTVEPLLGRQLLRSVIVDVLADVLGSSRSLCRLLCLQVVRDIGPHHAQHGDDEQDEGDRAGKEGCVAAVGVADALTEVALKLAGQDEGQN